MANETLRIDVPMGEHLGSKVVSLDQTEWLTLRVKDVAVESWSATARARRAV
jgi:hypothetical protein